MVYGAKKKQRTPRGLVVKQVKKYPQGVEKLFFKEKKMNKIEKALAKFFHAMGEEKKEMPANAGNPAFMAKYMAFLELQSFPGKAAEKFFAMGAAAAHRQQLKPQGGKKSCATGSRKEQPPRGQNFGQGKTVEAHHCEERKLQKHELEQRRFRR